MVTADQRNVIDLVNKFSDHLTDETSHLNLKIIVICTCISLSNLQLKLAVILFYQGARKPCSGSERTNERTKNEGRRGKVHVLCGGNKCFKFIINDNDFYPGSSHHQRCHSVRPCHKRKMFNLK